MKHLLLVYHSKDGNTGRMAKAVAKGCEHPDVEVELRQRTAFAASVEDLLWADGLILGTPENFGYMSGAVKDFFDRTFYPTEGKVEGLPYCVFISAGNDGTGALTSIRRIASGYPFKEVQEPMIARGPVTAETLRQCEDFGLFMAAGIEAGIF